ncbi:MAG: hypothetical protein P4M11_14060 [Candidatus Pacebacteria bacterium]|nr:hypothetical protein [Candidatus Paceibacterota bacterium]
MDKLYSEAEFRKYVNPWLLSFKDPEDERKFFQTNTMNMQATSQVALFASVGLGLHFIYRVVSLASACAGTAILPYSTPIAEAALLTALVFATAIESTLRIFNLLEYIHGFFVYTTLPIITITAAFLTQRSPYFGVGYMSPLRQNV